MSQNLMNLALDNKRKSNQEALASCVDGNSTFPNLRTKLG